MNTFTRSLLFSAMAAVGLTQGCSCSDDDDPAPVVIDPPVGESITISGVAAKGLILNGNVNIHPIIDGVLSSTPVGTPTQTNPDDGSYTVNIENYDGNPFVVRVTTSSNTQMRCDLAAGCGDGSSFGDTVPLNDPDFNLDAVVPPVTTPVANVNVTSLTDITTDVLLHGIGNNATSNISDAINRAYSQVANRFGVIGNLRTLPVVDLTNPTAVANATPNDILANSFGPAIVQATQADNNMLSIASAITSFTNSFVNNGLSDLTSTSTLTGLNEILRQAQQVVTVVEQTATNANVTLNLGDLQTVLTNQIAFTEAQPPSDIGSQGTSSETAGATALEKAQALVKVINDLGANIDMKAVGDTTIGVKANELKLQLDTAQLAVGDGVEQVLEATGMTVAALSAAANAYEDGTWTVDGQGMWTPYVSEDGISVSMMLNMSTPAEGQDAVLESVSYMVGTAEQAATVPVVIDAVTTNVMVYMTANDDLDTTDGVVSSSSAGVETSTAAGSISIMGTAEVANVVKLTVKTGSGVTITDGMAVDTTLANGSTTEVTVSDIDLSLMAKLEQIDPEVTDPISFDGTLSADLSSLSIDDDVTWTDLGDQGTTTLKMVVLELTLAGTVMNATDSAVLSVTAKGNSNGIEFAQSWLNDDVVSETDTEAADAYAGASFNAMMQANLAGVSEAVVVSYNMARTSSTVANVGLNLSYPGVALRLSTQDVEDATVHTMRLVNQDGVIMTIVDDESADNVTGTIFVGTEKLADIEGPIVRYTVADTANDFLDLFDEEDSGALTEAAPLQ